MSFKPLADRLLVLMDSAPESYTTQGGQALATVKDANARLPIGTVVRVGKWWLFWLKGRRIMLEKYCGEDVPLYRKDGSLIPNMVIVKLEDVKGWDDGRPDESLPGA